MSDTPKKPLVLRFVSSKLLWSSLIVVLLCLAVYVSQVLVSTSITDKQAQFIADSVRRSAIQCYAIEGRFPDSYEGVTYLEDNYGLAIDHKRYVVYYESMGANLIPQIRVIALSEDVPAEDIAHFFGSSGGGG